MFELKLDFEIYLWKPSGILILSFNKYENRKFPFSSGSYLLHRRLNKPLLKRNKQIKNCVVALGRNFLDYNLDFAIFFFFSSSVKKFWVVGRKCDFVKCMEHVHKERLGAVLRKCEGRALSVLDEEVLTKHELDLKE